MGWDPNPETDIAGYRVQYGTASGSLTSNQTVGTSPEATLSGLEPGILYYCAVRAFNTSGLEGPLSSEISFVVPGEAVPEISVEHPSVTDGQTNGTLNPVNLGSTGDAEPKIAVSGPDTADLTDAVNAQDFGGFYVATTAAPRAFTLRNTGSSDLTGLKISIDGIDAADFAVPPLAVTSLAPDSSTSFQIAFQPAAIGIRNATLHIASNDADESPLSIALTGIGLTTKLLTLENVDGTTVEPDEAIATFGNTLIGTTGRTATYVVRNTGISELTGLRFTTTGLQASSFILDLPSGSSLEPGASLSFNVTFKPTSIGSHSAAVRVTSDFTLPDMLEIALDGNGFAEPDIKVYQDDGIRLTSGSGTVSFGNCNLGSTTVARTFTIKNSGTATLRGISVASEGPDFNASKPGATSLPPGATTTIKVSFQPNAAGSRKACLIIASNDTDERSFEINLTGKGIDVPDIVVECGGKSLVDDNAFANFGKVDTGSSGRSLNFTIRNAGGIKLDGLILTKSGLNASDFTISSALQTRSLASGASTTFKISFRTSKIGSRWAAIHIASNDPDESSFDIVLNGTGRRAGTATTTGLSGKITHPATPPAKGIEVIDGRKYLTLTIAKTPGMTVLPCDVEVSSDLLDWSSGKRHTIVLLDNAKVLKVRDNIPTTLDAKRFIRLKR